MKLLWASTNFLHPTTKGGQIRTLEMLKRLHRRHEIHYVAIEDPAQPEGPARSREYSTRSYPFRHSVPGKNSIAFLGQLAAGLFSPMPLAISRFSSPALGKFIESLLEREGFDRAVVDFLAPTSYYPALERAVLFQHNVETMIWRRHAEHAPDQFRKLYFRLQAKRMFDYERRMCRRAGHIVAVSTADAETMRRLFGVTRISEIPTGVDLDYFAPPASPPKVADLVFVGSMDWLPNVDGVLHFVREALPLIRRRRPECTLAIVGRTPPSKISGLARQDPRILVTGTVPDIRPHLWGSSVSIVPLRIGGGTRLKIYESMAARVPVVSTSVGAEGLSVSPPENIRIADQPEGFAAQCLELLEDPSARERLGAAAWELVSARFSWEEVARSFERILEAAPAAS
jgi:glycosyltransferase involved in cell wall biosynthesis